MKKLNFGCGSIQPEGWVNYDSDPQFNAVIPPTGIRAAYMMPFVNEEFDIIVAHCCIQMTEWHDLPALFKELLRILKPGGVLRVSLPDIVSGFSAYIAGDIKWFPNSEEDLAERFSAWLTWYSTTKTLMTRTALAKKLTDAGFRDTAMVGFKQAFYTHKESTELDTRKGECYFLEAIK